MPDLRTALAIARKRLETGYGGYTGYKPPKLNASNDLANTDCVTHTETEGVTRVTCLDFVTPVTPASQARVTLCDWENSRLEQNLTRPRNPVTPVTPGKQSQPGNFNFPIATPAGFSEKQWESIRTGAEAFAHQWAAQAYGLGWLEDELFGLDPTAPAARVDRRGLAFLLHAGDHVVTLEERGADIVTVSGGRQRYYRKPLCHRGLQIA